MTIELKWKQVYSSRADVFGYYLTPSEFLDAYDNGAKPIQDTPTERYWNVFVARARAMAASTTPCTADEHWHYQIQ